MATERGCGVPGDDADVPGLRRADRQRARDRSRVRSVLDRHFQVIGGREAALILEALFVFTLMVPSLPITPSILPNLTGNPKFIKLVSETLRGWLIRHLINIFI